MDEQTITKYLQGECSPEEARRVQEWLYYSEENRKVFFQTKALWNYRVTKYFSATEQVDRALARLNQSIDRSEAFRKKEFYIRVARYAASIVVVLTVSLILWNNNRRSSSSDLITVNIGQTDSSHLVILNDGSRVWLNSNSSITYPEKFSNEKRIISFSGEAFFEVRHDSLSSFTVQTSNLQVEVLGTSFNVRAYPSERRTETTLLNGKVALQNKKGDNLKILEPGYMAAFDKKSEQLSLKEVDTDHYIAWRHGLIIFTNATLDEITEKLSALYQVRFVFDTPIADVGEYNFTFRKNQSIEQVMDMLSFIAPMQYRKDGNQIFVDVKTPRE